jgi:hypothetical protein
VTRSRTAKSITTKDAAKTAPALDIVAAVNHPKLFQPWFPGLSWDGWAQLSMRHSFAAR